MREDIKERIEMIKRGEVPYGYTKTEIGLVLKEWKLKKVNSVVDIRNDLRTPISAEIRNTMKGEYPYYGPTQVQDYINSYMIEKPSVLIGEDGDHFLKYQEKEMTMYVDGKYSVNNHAHVIQEKEGSYIKWFMYAFQHRNLFKSITRQGAGRYKLTKDALGKLVMQVPKMEEQKKIIRILEIYDNSIYIYNKNIEIKKQNRKWLLQNLLTGIKRLPGFVSEWKVMKMQCLFDERIEINASNSLLLSITANGIIPRAEIEGKDNSCEDKSKYKKIYLGDIGYNTMRMWQGVSAYSNFEGIVSPAYTVLKPKVMIDAKFYSYLFKLPKSISMFYRYSQGLVDDTRNLKYENFKKVSLYVPIDIKEQIAIAQVLSTADKEIELLEKQLEQIKLEKKAMMQLLLTGIVRVNEN